MKTGIAAAAACVAWILPQIALAVVIEPPLTASGLGGLQSAVSFCEKVDPEHGERIRDKAEKMMKGLSHEKLESMRRSADFKKNYAAVKVVLDGIPKDDAVHMCTAASK
jgi:hypothetical protein